MLRALLLLFLVSTLLVGCATHKPMTRDQYLAETQKEYENIPREEFFKAAEELFILNDGNDYNFSYTENRMMARNNWMIYMVFSVAQGTNFWRLEAEEKNGALQAQVNMVTKSGAIVGGPTGGGGAQATSLPQSGRAPEGPLIYKLFWARMDYLLGKSETWPTCSDAEKWGKESDVWGRTTGLCWATATNDLPQEIEEAKEAKQQEKREERGNSPSGTY